MDPFHKLLSYSAYVSGGDKGDGQNCDASFVKAFNSFQAFQAPSTDTRFNMDLSLRKALVSYRDVEQLLIPRAIDEWKKISTRYDFEYWRRQYIARHQMVRDRFRRVVNKLMLKDKLITKEQSDPFARYIGAKSPELREAVQSTIAKRRRQYLRQIFQYAVRREVMRRRAVNPAGDPWDSFFYAVYRLTKPTRSERGHRQQISLRTSVRRKLSVSPAMVDDTSSRSSPTTVLNDRIEQEEDDVSVSLSSTSNILVHDETVFQVFSSFALHSLTGDDKVESGTVRVSASSLNRHTSPPRLRPPTPPSTAGTGRRLSRSRERRLHIELQSRDLGRDGQVVETIEIVHNYGTERFKSTTRSDFDAFVDQLVQPLDRHLQCTMNTNVMPRRTKSQRELNETIERLAYTTIPRSNVYRDPLTLDKILRSYEEKGHGVRTRAKSENPRWNIQRPIHSPDGKPPSLPRLTWLPIINGMSKQKQASRSPASRRIPLY